MHIPLGSMIKFQFVARSPCGPSYPHPVVSSLLGSFAVYTYVINCLFSFTTSPIIVLLLRSLLLLLLLLLLCACVRAYVCLWMYVYQNLIYSCSRLNLLNVII